MPRPLFQRGNGDEDSAKDFCGGDKPTPQRPIPGQHTFFSQHSRWLFTLVRFVILIFIDTGPRLPTNDHHRQTPLKPAALLPPVNPLEADESAELALPSVSCSRHVCCPPMGGSLLRPSGQRYPLLLGTTAFWRHPARAGQVRLHSCAAAVSPQLQARQQCSMELAEAGLCRGAEAGLTTGRRGRPYRRRVGSI